MASHPGGRFETLMRGEHGSHRMVATCAVVIHQRDVPEAMRLPQARSGFLTSLDKLEEHLAHLVGGDGS